MGKEWQKGDPHKTYFANTKVTNKKHLKELGVPRYQIWWKPKPDITTYELAVAMPFIIAPNTYKEYPQMSEQVRRHFIINQIW